MNYLFHPIQDNNVLHQTHFIVSIFDHSIVSNIESGIKKALMKFGCTSAILSNVTAAKFNCITKEKYEEMYKANKETEKREDLSVGEDLETFIRKIKNGQINKYTIPEDGERIAMFLSCLLKTEERRKLEQKDNAFMNTFSFHQVGLADVHEVEWKASESNLKFARSVCWRKTYSIDV